MKRRLTHCHYINEKLRLSSSLKIHALIALDSYLKVDFLLKP
jgi:hypothetical protein